MADKKTTNAVIRSLEIIGEAAKKIPEDVRTSHREIPWQEIGGMRDKLIHEYFGVLIWRLSGKPHRAVSKISMTPYVLPRRPWTTNPSSCSH
ncbi:MAG: HepT-like ribonuclease domain-containing protein [Thermodesulfobacteriota bacterium]|nr:HepT-like ribonuclease domain-containing protein [Thermodesulfobacteriota bacterium]